MKNAMQAIAAQAVAARAIAVRAIAAQENAAQELEGLICILIGVVGLGFGTAVSSSEAVRDEIEVQTTSMPGQPRAAARPPG